MDTHTLIIDGQTVLIDLEDLTKVDQHVWHIWDTPYPTAFIAGRVRSMHSVILDLPKGTWAGFVNDNPLDQRKVNIELVDRSTRLQHSTRSSYRGVSRAPKTAHGYFSRISRSGKTYYLGTYNSAKEAAQAYDIAAVHLYGPTAAVNFTDPGDAARPSVSVKVRRRLQKLKLLTKD